MNNPTDRDLLIRTDADVKHLSNGMAEVRNRQTTLEQTTSTLAKNLNDLTYNVGALVKGMEDAKVLANVGRHSHRLMQIEQWQVDHSADCEKARNTWFEHLRKVEDQLTEDRKMWQPWVSLAQHWKWMLGGALATVAFVGWPTIVKIMQWIAAS